MPGLPRLDDAWTNRSGRRPGYADSPQVGHHVAGLRGAARCTSSAARCRPGPPRPARASCPPPGADLGVERPVDLQHDDPPVGQDPHAVEVAPPALLVERVRPAGRAAASPASAQSCPTSSSANDWAPPAMSPRTSPKVLPWRSLRICGDRSTRGGRSSVRPCCTQAASSPMARRTLRSRSAASRAACSRGSRGGPRDRRDPAFVRPARLVEEVARREAATRSPLGVSTSMTSSARPSAGRPRGRRSGGRARRRRPRAGRRASGRCTSVERARVR